jgi:carnitine O-acetyltransferase
VCVDEQVAYFRVYRACVCTYETIMTKAFFHGRTEAGFIVSHASKALCEAFNASSSQESLHLLLKAALDAHVDTVRKASQGRGIRTLFALKSLLHLEQQEQQEQQGERQLGPDGTGREAAQGGGADVGIFSDVGWRRLNHNILSTSNCGNPALRMFGFGAVQQDGFGVGYIIKDDNVQFCVSSYNRQTERLIYSLEVLHHCPRVYRVYKV